MQPYYPFLRNKLVAPAIPKRKDTRGYNDVIDCFAMIQIVMLQIGGMGLDRTRS